MRSQSSAVPTPLLWHTPVVDRQSASCVHVVDVSPLLPEHTPLGSRLRESVRQANFGSQSATVVHTQLGFAHVVGDDHAIVPLRHRRTHAPFVPAP